MLLYANGCSMTIGAELADPAESCYPSLIAKKFGMTVFNASQAAGSNSRILRTSLLWVANFLQNGGAPEELFVLIGWSGPDRREFGLSSEEGAPDPELFWRSLHINYQLPDSPSDLIRLRKILQRSFWSNRESMARFLIEVNSLQSFLIHNSVRFCFSHSIPVCPLHPELTPLAKSVNSETFYRFMDPGTDFLTYSRSAGVPFGPMHHPLEEGHEKWACQLSAFIKEKELL